MARIRPLKERIEAAKMKVRRLAIQEKIAKLKEEAARFRRERK